MALDGIILSKEKEDLIKKLPIRINRITQVSANEIVFNVHAARKRTNLIISCHSVYNRIHLTGKEYIGYDNPSGFIMLLRKCLQNGIIEKIEQNGYDRYLILYIRSLNDLYDEVHYRLHIELMGKYANIILVNSENKIMDAFKRIPPYENNKRTIWPGFTFTMPDDQKKHDPFFADAFDEHYSLVKQFQGFSPQLEKEVHYRLTQSDFPTIMNEIAASNSLYIAKDRDNIYYHVIPLQHTGLNFSQYEINEGFDCIYYALEEKERIKHVSNDLYKLVKRQLKHFSTKLHKLYESLNEAQNCEEFKENGDLLYMTENLYAKGQKNITVVDFMGENKTIQLDQRFTVKENANKYYQLYHKKKKSQKYLLEQIEITEKELDYFQSIDEQLSIANYNDALMIKEDMTKNGYLKDTAKKKKKKNDKWHLYQIEYQGHTITFGKNNLQNENLTFSYAKKHYLWFHAQKYHGAHLCIDSDKVSEEVLRYAANLAAYFSKGRYSSSVPVDYCQVKDIRKIKGSKTGLVSIKNYKTIFIDPHFEDESDIIAI